MNQRIESYIASFIREKSSLFLEMEQYAKEQNVPIMESVGMEALLQFLRLQQPKTILEIGTAIGYSALRMAYALPNTTVVTIERDKKRYEEALLYIQRSDASDRVKPIFGDALEVFDTVKEWGPFDAIFIDAAKGQYQKFFELYERLLTSEGSIYSDNVLFKGLVVAEEFDNKRIKQLVKKIRAYNEWLMHHPSYHSIILPVGDGIAISKKRGGSNEKA
ncbi:O-methyltransferase [Aeribacillus pallidus]|uniref:O-methyltransferase n=1 Tax=Aeribacillus pallidus TaxID=33936 RepID=UPI003D248DE9